MFQIWLDAVDDYALFNALNSTFTWIAIHDDTPTPCYDFLEQHERKWYALVESPSLNKTGDDAPQVVFTGTEDECISFIKALILIRS